MCNKYFKNSPIPETKANLAAMLEEPTWFFLKRTKLSSTSQRKDEKEGGSPILQCILGPLNHS